MICIPIGAATNAEMFELLRQAETEPADLVELRLDHLREPPRVEELVAASPRPVIATCRSREEGGGFAGPAAERRDILLRSARSGAAYLDAEPADVPHLADRRGAVLIVSLHDFERTPEDLEKKVRDLAAAPGDWVKFAVAARRQSDNLRVFATLAGCPKPCIGIAMGEVGLPTRILGLSRGSRVTFGSLETGRESAPGQPTARELAELYRVKAIDKNTAVYGLLGNPVAQSRGYRLHNRAFAELGLDAVYISFLAEDAKEFLATMPAGLNLRGLSVTMPHKRAALEWSTLQSEAARRIGAANTLTPTPEGWRADNTDCLAVFEAVKEQVDKAGMSLAGGRALVLGSGGATRAIGVALFLLGCRIAVSARDSDKTACLAGEMGWEAVEWARIAGGGWNVVANSTPVGMYPDIDSTPFPASGWRPGMVAFEAVYEPKETRFLREAAAAGAVAVDGEDMFLRQAAGQFRLWTGRGMPGAEGS